MRSFGQRTLGGAERVALDAALADAFAPVREATTPLSASRVRAAVRWSRPDPAPLGGLALVARLSELAVSVAAMAFLFAGISAPLVTRGSVELSRDPVVAGARPLNGAIAAQRFIDSLAMDYRTVAPLDALNAAAARRRELPVQPAVVLQREGGAIAP